MKVAITAAMLIINLAMYVMAGGVQKANTSAVEYGRYTIPVSEISTLGK